MKKSALALFLITLVAHGTWCAAERSTNVDAVHHVRPHLQVQEIHETEGKKLLQITSPRKFGHAHVGGGGGGPGGGVGAGGRATGGGAANTRPHNSKNGGVVVQPASFTSILALVVASAFVLSTLSL